MKYFYTSLKNVCLTTHLKKTYVCQPTSKVVNLFSDCYSLRSSIVSRVRKGSATGN